jgi:hypothetical protein
MNMKNIFILCSKIAFMLVLISFSFLAQAIQNISPGNTISGFVWLDNNSNGLLDPGEPGFAQTVPDFGAPNVALYPTGSTTLIDTFSLDESSNGEYSFENIPDGNYYVCVSNEFRPLGLTVTTPNAGDDTIDSDFDIYACSYDISVIDGQVVMRDLGLSNDTNPDGSGTNNEISGIVWLDTNGDGLRNNNEPVFAQTVPGFGAPNVAIYTTGSTEPIAVSALDENNNGRYRFEVPDGDYYVCVSNEFRPLGLTVTTPNAGDDAIDSDFDIYACSYGISVTEPDTPERDLGLSDIFTETGNISGTVWVDRNQDGIRQKSFPDIESGIDSIALELFRAGDSEPIETTVSSAIELTVFLKFEDLGRFQFENILPGDYVLCAVDNYSGRGVRVTIQDAGDDALDNDFDNNGCAEVTIEADKDTTVGLGLIVEPGPIIVNNSCAVDAAIIAATLGIPSGNCHAGYYPGRETITLEAGARYTSITIPAAIGRNPNAIDFNGNGAFIERFTTPGSGSFWTVGSINNATIGTAAPSGGDLFISSSAVNNLLGIIDDGFVSISNSTVCGVIVESLQYTFSDNRNPCR